MMDDTIKYVVHATDGRQGDIVSIPRNFLKGCMMKPKAFDDMVFKLMTEVGTQVKAYEKAEEIHYQVFGCNRYSSYESYYYAKR
jgi:hypothetical protein